jgi:hypothetical protein
LRPFLFALRRRLDALSAEHLMGAGYVAANHGHWFSLTHNPHAVSRFAHIVSHCTSFFLSPLPEIQNARLRPSAGTVSRVAARRA